MLITYSSLSSSFTIAFVLFKSITVPFINVFDFVSQLTLSPIITLLEIHDLKFDYNFYSSPDLYRDFAKSPGSFTVSCNRRAR